MGSEVQFTELIQLAEPLLHRDIGERLLWEWVVFLCCEKDYFRGVATMPNNGIVARWV